MGTPPFVFDLWSDAKQLQSTLVDLKVEWASRTEVNLKTELKMLTRLWWLMLSHMTKL